MRIVPVCLALLSHSIPAAAAAEPSSLALDGDATWSVAIRAGESPAVCLVRVLGIECVPPDPTVTGDPGPGCPDPCTMSGVEVLPLPPGPGPSEAAAVQAVSAAGPGRARIGHLLFLEPDGRRYEILVRATGAPPQPALVWAGWTTPSGDPGERLGWRVSIRDDPGGAAVVVERLSEAIRACGAEEWPGLHRRGYDWGSGRLRPVTLPRPEFDPAGAALVTPSAEPPGLRVPLLEYRGASSSHGDGGEPMRTAIPRGLEDMDGRSGWAEGVGGAGRMEFVTARVVTGAVPGTWIAVRPIDGEAAGAAAQRNRPAALLVIDGAGRRRRLDLPDDAAARTGGVLWFRLPEPIEGGCLSAALIDVHAATSADGRRADVTWISDLQLFAVLPEAGEEEAIRRVIEDDGSAAAARDLLRAWGDRAVDRLARMAPSLGPTGTARVAAFLFRRTEPAAAATIAALLAEERPGAERAVRAEAAAMGEEAVPPLAALLAAPAARATAADLLATHGGRSAATLLARALASAADDADRAVLRNALAALVRRLPAVGDEVVMEARLALEEERPDTVASLLRTVGAGLREYRGAITMLVGETLAATTAFAPRYHLLRIAGDLLAEGETATAADLLRAATAAEEPELRVEATRGLAAAPPDTALTPLLEDPWPGVREAAARAIGRRGLDAERAALARLYAVETWPRVRAAAAEAFLGGSAPWPGDDVARRLLSDSSPIVRERAVNLLDARDDDRSAAMLEEVAGSRTSVPLRERALAALARRCHPGLKPLVVRIVEASVQEDASVGDQRVALEAIRALGAAAPPGIRSLLEEIVREAPFEPLRAAAIAALGEVGEPEARAAIEPYLRHPDPLVAEAATAALRLIEEGRAAARCGAP